MHDQNFKNLILDYPHQALAFFAADEFNEIEQATRIIPIRQEQLKERLGERFRELDTPLLVEWPDGHREALLFVIEEESDPRRFSIHRLAHYCLDLAELFDTTRVVPVVIFLRAGDHPTELTLAGDRHEYLCFRYLKCPLAQLPFEAWRDSDNLVARLNLPNMQYDSAQKLEVYASASRGLAQLESDPERQLKYADFIDIYTHLTDEEKQRYHSTYPREYNDMLTFSQRFIQQGEARILLRLFKLKFGDIPDRVRERIETADPDTLLNWSDRILTAETPDAIFDGEEPRPTGGE
jgi:hypothetical protein